MKAIRGAAISGSRHAGGASRKPKLRVLQISCGWRVTAACFGPERNCARIHPGSTVALSAGISAALRVEDLVRDLGFAFRSLAKAPGYTAVAVLAFALAIGANVAVATVLDAVVLRPLPYTNSDRLVLISHGTSLSTQISYANARDRARNSQQQKAY